MLAGAGMLTTAGSIGVTERHDVFAGTNVVPSLEYTFDPFAARLIAIRSTDHARAETDPYAARLIPIALTDPTRAETDPYGALLVA